MLGWLRSWLGGGESRSAPPPPRAAQLRLEALEAREVPATNLWLGGTGAWNVAGNWSDGVPTADDVLIFGGPSNLGVNFPTTSGLSFAGLVVQSSYTGTLGFQAPITFGSYQQSGGYTFQFSPAATVTATGMFVWTGGGINTSTNPATYELKGVTTGQIGTDTTDLYSGSKFVIEKLGSVTSWVTQSGVLNLENGVGIEVLLGGTFEQRQLIDAPNNKPEVKAPESSIVLNQGDALSSKGGSLPSVLVLDGKFTVNSGVANVKQKVDGTDWGVVMQGGTIVIKNGATLKATHGVYMNEGTLNTLTIPGTGASNKATIEGVFRIDAGLIELGLADAAESTTASFSTLLVTDRCYLWGTGTFKPKVKGGSAAFDVIETNDKFNIGGYFVLHAVKTDPVDTGVWHDVLKSDLGFTDAVDPVNGNSNEYAMERHNDEVISVKLKP